MSAGATSTGRVCPRALGDVFAPVDVLPVQQRLRLAALLSTPGRASAILPGQLASMPLPADPHARRTLAEVISDGLDRATLTALGDHRLDAIVPALPAEWLLALPAPTQAAIERHAAGALPGQCAVGKIAGWTGFGPGRIAKLVVAAVEAALQLAATDDDNERPPPITEDIATVLARDASTGGALRRLLERIAAAGPTDVCRACARILAAPPSDAERCLGFLDRALAAAGDERDRGVFEHAALSLGPPVTRADLAAAIGLGLERVRQLAWQGRDRVDAATRAAPREIDQLAEAMSESLGTATPLAALDEAIIALGLPPLPDTRTRLLLRMAGPYEPVEGFPGWVAADPQELVAETRRMLREDGGVRVVDHVVKELLALGMRGEHVDDWLARQPVRVIDDLVVLTTGTTGDIATRVLDARGRPLTVAELSDWMPGPPDQVEALWRGMDRRFEVLGSGALALADWPDWVD